MYLTRSRIAYDLSISPHRAEMPYGEQTVTYVFSSELYRQKFLDRVESYREEIGASLTKRFGFKVQPGILADLRLYTTIEKRGFLVIQDGVEIECQNKVTLDGVTMTLPNSAEL